MLLSEHCQPVVHGVDTTLKQRLGSMEALFLDALGLIVSQLLYSCSTVAPQTLHGWSAETNPYLERAPVGKALCFTAPEFRGSFAPKPLCVEGGLLHGHSVLFASKQLFFTDPLLARYLSTSAQLCRDSGGNTSELRLFRICAV